MFVYFGTPFCPFNKKNYAVLISVGLSGSKKYPVQCFFWKRCRTFPYLRRLPIDKMAPHYTTHWRSVIAKCAESEFSQCWNRVASLFNRICTFQRSFRSSNGPWDTRITEGILKWQFCERYFSPEHKIILPKFSSIALAATVIMTENERDKDS